MRSITLREYGPPVEEELTPREHDRLVATNLSWQKTLGLPSPPLRIDYDGQRAAIRARGVSGTIRVGTLNIELAPKFLDLDSTDAYRWREAFWRILMIAQDGKSLLGRASGTDAESISIADLLAEVFLSSYARGATRGLPLEYTEVSESASTVRGSFDSSRVATWLATPWRIPSRDNVLTTTTQLTHLLSWAAQELRHLVSSVGRARELDIVHHGLVAAQRSTPIIDLAERIQLGVQHEALRPALEVSLLLLRGHGVRHGAGDRDVIGFLWRSEDIYERFLFWLCRAAGLRRHLQVRKASARFGLSSSAPPLTTTPDVTFVSSAGTVVAVLDAKYKGLNSSPKASDSYQIFTAASHFGCREVGLVYPSGVERAAAKWLVASGLGGEQVTIAALSLNLMKAATAPGRQVLVDIVGEWLDGLNL